MNEINGGQESAREEGREEGTVELDEGGGERKGRTLVLQPSPVSEEFEKSEGRFMLRVPRELERSKDQRTGQFVSSMEREGGSRWRWRRGSEPLER